VACRPPAEDGQHRAARVAGARRWRSSAASLSPGAVWRTAVREHRPGLPRAIVRNASSPKWEMVGVWCLVGRPRPCRHTRPARTGSPHTSWGGHRVILRGCEASRDRQWTRCSVWTEAATLPMEWWLRTCSGCGTAAASGALTGGPMSCRNCPMRCCAARDPVNSLVGLCRASEHRRGHAALYDVLSESGPTSWTAILDAVRLRATEDRDRQDIAGQHVIARQVQHSGHSSSPSSGHFQSAGSSRVTGAQQRARPAMSPAPLTACNGPTGMSTHSSDQGRGRTASVPTVHRPCSPEPR
jgi:hypothetical protein